MHEIKHKKGGQVNRRCRVKVGDKGRHPYLNKKLPKPDELFADSYCKSRDLGKQLTLLQDHYSFIININITGNYGFKGVISDAHTQKTGDKRYQLYITSEGYDKKQEAYMLCREYLRLWIINNGLSFSVLEKTPELQRAVDRVKAISENYLIEQEIIRQFEYRYQDLVLKSIKHRSRIFEEKAGLDPMALLHVKLDMAAIYSLYSEVDAPRIEGIFGKTVDWKLFSQMLVILNGMDPLNPFYYRRGVSQLCSLLLGSAASYNGKELYLDSPAEAVKHMAELRAKLDAAAWRK